MNKNNNLVVTSLEDTEEEELKELFGPDAPVPEEDRFATGKNYGAGARSPLFWKALLFMAALIWGFSTFVMKDTLDVIPTYLLIAARFLPSALIMFTLFHKSIKVHFNRRNILVGAGMGFLMFMGYALQTLGLNETTAGKSAFLTGTYCILVPFISYALAREPLTRYNLGAAFLCLGGIAFVALDNFTMGVGDAQTLAGALFYAMQMSVVSKYGRNLDVNVITFWMFLTIGILSGGATLLFEAQPPISVWTPKLILIVIGFLATICTCTCLLIQNTALAHIPAATGSLIMSLESPSGVMFSVLFAGEVLTGRLIIGFTLIFISILLSETHFSFLAKYLPKRKAAVAQVGEA